MSERTPTLSGRLTICRRQSHDHNSVLIRLADESSGVTFLEVEMPTAYFAETIMGCGDQRCQFSLRWLESVGKVREHKEVVIAGIDGLYGRDRESDPRVAEALAPYEVDGWRGNPSDLFNGQRKFGEGGYRVGFTRFVDPPVKGAS